MIGDRGLKAAEDSAPDLIRAYNASVGGVNDDAQGYHHTITLFFLRRIDRFLAPFTSEGSGARATRLLASPLSAPDYVLGYYSKERLFSVDARRGWLEPDMKALAWLDDAETQ